MGRTTIILNSPAYYQFHKETNTINTVPLLPPTQLISLELQALKGEETEAASNYSLIYF